MPNPDTPSAPTAAQIVDFARIAWITTDEARSVISSVADQDESNAKWAVALSMIAAWPGFQYGGKRRTKRIGAIEFFDNPSSGGRLDFRNELRRLYGLTDLTSDTGSSTEICYSHPATCATPEPCCE